MAIRIWNQFKRKCCWLKKQYFTTHLASVCTECWLFSTGQTVSYLSPSVYTIPPLVCSPFAQFTISFRRFILSPQSLELAPPPLSHFPCWSSSSPPSISALPPPPSIYWERWHGDNTLDLHLVGWWFKPISSHCDLGFLRLPNHSEQMLGWFLSRGISDFLPHYDQ